MTTVTAVILTYNKAWIIDRFVGSFLSQSLQPDQVILVDDASTDGTQDKVKVHRRDWQMIELARNVGQSRARNIGHACATGDYIIFLDADISMRPDMLEEMRRTLDESPSISIVYGHYDRQGSRKDHLKAIPWDPELLRQRNWISTMSMVRRIDLPVPPFDTALTRYEDWDLWLTMAKGGKKGLLIDRVLFTAFYDSNDLSGKGESTEWFRRVKQKHGVS